MIDCMLVIGGVYKTVKYKSDRGGMMTQIERITYYEEILDKVEDASAKMDEALESFSQVQSLVKELDAYYGSEDWRKDFEDDEAGRLPTDLKRGVLSEDAAYDALTNHHQLLIRLLEVVTEAMKGKCCLS